MANWDEIEEGTKLQIEVTVERRVLKLPPEAPYVDAVEIEGFFGVDYDRRIYLTLEGLDAAKVVE